MSPQETFIVVTTCHTIARVAHVTPAGKRPNGIGAERPAHGAIVSSGRAFLNVRGARNASKSWIASTGEGAIGIDTGTLPCHASVRADRTFISICASRDTIASETEIAYTLK